MKNVLLVSIFGAFLFFAPSQSFAQTQGQIKKEEVKENKDKAKEQKKHDKDYMDKDSQKKQDKLFKDNQGNAYGKDKGDMSGREFGQHRAEMARKKAEHARTRLSDAEISILFQRERLLKLRQAMEEEAKNKNADRKAMEEREMRIRLSEERLAKLQVALNESLERLKRTENSLQAVINNK